MQFHTSIYGTIMKQLLHKNASFLMTDFRHSSTLSQHASHVFYLGTPISTLKKSWQGRMPGWDTISPKVHLGLRRVCSPIILLVVINPFQGQQNLLCGLSVYFLWNHPDPSEVKHISYLRTWWIGEDWYEIERIFFMQSVWKLYCLDKIRQKIF